MRAQFPKCYYEAAMNDVRTERLLYRLHPSLLRKRSGMLHDMFTLPSLTTNVDASSSSSDRVVDGCDDDHPIHLPHPNITIRKFDHLLTYMFCGPSDYPSGDVFLFDVLDLSHFLDIADGIDYVFRLAREYGITKWIEPAMRSMMEWRGSTFTRLNAMDIGFDAFYHITIAKFRLEEMRKGMAYNPPALKKGPECRRPTACKLAWEEQWWTGLAPHILHPNWTRVGERIKRESEATKIPGVCEGCQNETFTLMEERNHFSQDAELIESCIATVKRLHGDDSPLGKPFSWSD
ncbi:hypothetical protein MD484_g6222, partial [Candolleomyces efflorescens]